MKSSKDFDKAARDLRDSGYVPASWEFDQEVTRVFDDMLQRSIPQYELMRSSTVDIAKEFILPNTYVMDVGCARGEAMEPLIRSHSSEGVRFFGLDMSGPMLQAARLRFTEEIREGLVQIEEVDLRASLPEIQCSVILAILTVQFTPIEYRPHILQRIHDRLIGGGALVLVEKVLGRTSRLDDLIVKNYLLMKRRNGYSEDEIQRKRLSLEGRLVPCTAGWNEEMLRDAGFREVECFWRWMNFAGWVAIR